MAEPKIAAARELYEALAAQDEAVDLHSKCPCATHGNEFLTGMCMDCTSRYMRASSLRSLALAKARGEPC